MSSGLKPDSRATKPSLVIMDLMRPVQGLESSMGDDASGFFHSYFDLVGVREQNQQLKQEIAELEAGRTRMLELETENRHLADLLELREALGTTAVAADVIGSDATGLSRTIVISDGSAQGLRYDQAVISIDGVVGKIIALSHHSARVLLINDHNSALDVFDQRSRARGIVAGVIDDGLTMKYVDRSEDIKPGDVIMTSGMDGVFPKGLLVGQVARVSQKGPGLFLNVEVNAAVDFRRLEQVMVLTEKPPELAAQNEE